MGKTVLFLHGLGGSGDDWNSIIPIFETHGWRCEAPTLFQHLRTQQNPPETLNELSILDWIKSASDYADQLLEEEGEKPVIIGHCLGGFVAKKLVEFGQAKSAAFISPLCLREDKHATSALPLASLLLRQSSQKTRNASKLCNVGLSLSFLNRAPKHARKEIMANMRYESSRLLEEISQPDPSLMDAVSTDTPSLFIGCGKDRIVSSSSTYKTSENWALINSDTTFKNYEDIGHWPFAENGADRMFSYVENWLRTATNLKKTVVA